MKLDVQDISVCKQTSKVVSCQKKVEKRLGEETSSWEMGERKYAIVLNQFLYSKPTILWYFLTAATRHQESTSCDQLGSSGPHMVLINVYQTHLASLHWNWEHALSGIFTQALEIASCPLCY